MAKIDRHYQDELNRLHEMAAEYAELNPSHAGYLASAGNDPDAERILEGVAFLTAGLRSELEKDQAQLLQNVLQVASPDLLRPLPSITLMQFKGRPALKELLTLPAGTPVAGKTPQDDSICEFRTLMASGVLPLEIRDASFRKSREKEAGASCLSVSFRFTFGDSLYLANKPLAIYLNTTQGVAARMLDALLQHCVGSAVVWPGQQVEPMEPPVWNTDLMQWAFLSDDQPELPAQRLARRYFSAPELAQGFCFRLPESAAEQCATEFSVNFYFDSSADWPKADLAKVLRLNVVPAANLFIRDAPPRVRDLRQVYMPLAPRKRDGEFLCVYGIEQVSGQYRSEPESHLYLPFWRQTSMDALRYQEQLSAHPVTDELELSIALGGGERDEQEVIKARVYCTNGADASTIPPGRVADYISGSPELVQFENLTAPTPYRKALSSEQQYWQAVRQLSGNLMGHLTTDRLHAALKELVMQASPDRARQQINMKKVDAIQSVELLMTDRLVSAMSVRGYEVSLVLAGDHFSSKAEMHLFARLLQQFFISLVPVNYFCLLKVTDQQTGEVLQWSPMLGRKPLL
ncbi:type VI secretion system baseplate subunit TssF [Oceanospirillum linum]|uniref:Type VI secretion system protein ImpG n=1 Tax=Oceanospirillum linum TaxID=966 RepID=A0A1T1HD29_OCELI|nr:type VI secretion system baseplate subunit TssF [Oceanospirillum linum]OOV87764.1 hypothetical protein BTA35_0207085 [Oceanospirillum linum]SEG13096.1 type VI secretion system protein ImpG [Oleiphilus messinensis]SMP10195.1 type VI secretion system protein ImpG [Oceanospirillum linum]